MTEISLPFKIGEKVWIADCFGYSFEVECLHCNRTGKVELARGGEMPCGVCQARGTHLKHRDYKFRPRQITITGFDIHNKRGQMEVWIYGDGVGNFVRPNEIIRSFQQAREKARASNKKYGWPKKDYHPSWPEKSYVYWGRKVGPNKRA